MSNIDFEIAAFVKFLTNNPVVVLHVLAYASAITLVIAIVTDALLAQRQTARSGKTMESPAKGLMPRQLPGLQRITPTRRPLPGDRK